MQDLERQFLGTSDLDGQPHLAALALAEAINRARAAQAERDSLSRDNRSASVARLEALRKKLQPLYAAIPRDVEMFDLGLIPTERPRLFVDMIAYVEMGQDQRIYRLFQETRAGRVSLLETEDPDRIVDRVTDYVAERLVERERALAVETAASRRLPPPAWDAAPIAQAEPTTVRDLRPQPLAAIADEVRVEPALPFRDQMSVASSSAVSPVVTQAAPAAVASLGLAATALAGSAVQDLRDQAETTASLAVAETSPVLADPADLAAEARGVLAPVVETVAATSVDPGGAIKETVDDGVAELRERAATMAREREAAATALIETVPQAVSAPVQETAQTIASVAADVASPAPLAEGAVAAAADTAATAVSVTQTAPQSGGAKGLLSWLLPVVIGAGLGALALYLTLKHLSTP